MDDEKKALMYGLSAVLLWSTVATAFKLTLTEFSPIQMQTFASYVSVIALFFICKIQKKSSLIWPTFLSNPKFFITLGLINPFAYYLILFKAYNLLPASQAQSINYSWAITLTFMAAIFLKQKIRKQDYLAALLCYAGVIVIATQGHVFAMTFASPSGVALALLSTLLWAGYWILNTKNTADPVISILLGFLISLPFSTIVMLYFGFTWNAISWQGWISVTYVGLFEMGITFFLWLNALKHTQNTAKISNLIFISPFISLILLSIIINEQIHISTFVGLVMIVIGLTVQQVKKKKSEAQIDQTI